MEKRQQPIDFRKDEVSYVMQRWRTGESCSLIGVGSVGKSNLLRHLSDFDVQKTYMNITRSADFKAILIDPNLLGALPQGADSEQFRCWAGYELLMHRLFMAFYPFEVLGKDDAQRFYEAYQALQDGTNPLYTYMGLRYFELGLDFFMRRGVKLVFMFDEFEEMLRSMPPRFFQNLRGLRDANKGQLSYLTFARTPLPVLVEQFDLPAAEMEAFIELFTDNVYYVGPYNQVDGRRMLDLLVQRNQKTLPDAVSEFLLWSTGCHAGLLRAAFRALDVLNTIDQTRLIDEETLDKILLKRPLRAECSAIWSSLLPAEQQILRAIAGFETYQTNAQTEQAVTSLVQKHLIRVDKKTQMLHIQPPIFRVFVQSVQGQGVE